MAKKITTLIIALVALTGAVIAQEATPPKVSVELVQRMDTELNEGFIGSNELSDTDPFGTRTEVKGSVAFALGSGVTVAPYIKDRYEAKLSPLTTPAGFLDRNRNRLYLGVDSNFAFDKALNLGINLEYRLASDIRDSAATTARPEHRFMPSVIVKGAISEFYYNINQGIPVILDFDGNTTDSSSVSLDGVYNAGLNFKLSDKESLKLDINNLLVVTNKSVALLGVVNDILNNFYFKVAFSTNGFTPALGFVYVSRTDANSAVTEDVAGGTLGLDFAKDNWSLGTNFQLGVNAARASRTEFQASVIFKIKI